MGTTEVFIAETERGKDKWKWMDYVLNKPPETVNLGLHPAAMYGRREQPFALSATRHFRILRGLSKSPLQWINHSRRQMLDHLTTSFC